MTLLRFSAFLIVILMLLVGCRQAMITQENAQGFDYAIVEADQSYRLTMVELYKDLKESRLFPDGGIIPADSIQSAIDSILLDTLDGLEANHVDLEDNYELFRQYRSRHREALVNRYLDEYVYSKVEIDSQAVADFYFSRPDLFTLKEQVLVYHILISPKGLIYGPDSARYEDMTRQDVAAEAERLAGEVRVMIDSPESFKEAAAAYSHDTSGQGSGGLVGWSERELYLHPFDSVAFSMEPGDISQPYQDTYGWHILYVEDYLPEGVPPFDAEAYAVATENYRVIQANRLGAGLMDTLLDEFDVQVNEALMDTNLYYVDVQEWVAIVNGQDTIDCNDARTAELAFRRQHRVANTTADMKRAMLQSAAQMRVVSLAARATGIDTLPQLVSEAAAMYHKYSKTLIKRGYTLDPYWKAPDSAVEKYYNEHSEEYQPSKPMKVQHIIVQDSLFGDFLRGQAMSGHEFLDLAEEHFPGDKESRRESADLGYISEDDVSEEFWGGAVRTVLGEVSHPIRTEQGFHIIKVLDRKEQKSIIQAGAEIQQVLKDRQKVKILRERLDSLITKYNVKFKGKIVSVHLEPLRMRTPLKW